MRIALWIVQVLLAVVFFAAGSMKAFTPMPDLATQMPGLEELPSFVPRLAGISEILGAVGLVLPAATRIRPGLTPLAAAGLMVVMLLAAIFHLSRGEVFAVPVNLLLGGLAGFVLWGRTTRATVAGRTATHARA